MEIQPYLERIGYGGSCEPTVETLRRLHLAHLFSVPFENLDIPLDHPIALSLPAFYDKIVRRRRGGFCYELNGLFGWLLEQLGFEVALLSGRVFQDGRPGAEFDHLVLLIQAEKRMIADVGFGELFLEPIPLSASPAQQRGGVSYRLTGPDSETILHRRQPESDWEPQYVFSLSPRRLSDFGARCHELQTSPSSIFRTKAVCTIATPDGRITLSNGRLIVTAKGRREERAVADEGEYRELLRAHFGVDLGEEERVDKLLAIGAPGE